MKIQNFYLIPINPVCTIVPRNVFFFVCACALSRCVVSIRKFWPAPRTARVSRKAFHLNEYIYTRSQFVALDLLYVVQKYNFLVLPLGFTETILVCPINNFLSLNFRMSLLLNPRLEKAVLGLNLKLLILSMFSKNIMVK